MTQDQVIAAAREARIGVMNEKLGFVVFNDVSSKHLERFYALAYRAGMERAAEICEAQHEEDRPGDYAYTIRAHAKKQPESTHDTDNV